MTAIAYRTANVDGFNIFYREAGAPDAPKLLLLHGFPSAGHMFRDLIPLLADRLHIIAPDLPGFGNSDMPRRGCTFDRLADTIDRFTEIVGFDRYAIYVFDYGAPTGFRLAVRHPDRITAIISQNGNAYEEGLSDGWSPIRAYWQDTSPATGRASRIPRCNSTCPTIRATSRSIRPSRSISGPIRRPCWRHWGQKRPILPAGEGRGVQARHRERDCALLRYQTFRAGDACPRGRGGHSRLPSLNDNVNRNSPDAS
jgi:pimeloyl-ACP methyl ester carboxylesterase